MVLHKKITKIRPYRLTSRTTREGKIESSCRNMTYHLDLLVQKIFRIMLWNISQ